MPVFIKQDIKDDILKKKEELEINLWFRQTKDFLKAEAEKGDLIFRLFSSLGIKEKPSLFFFKKENEINKQLYEKFETLTTEEKKKILNDFKENLKVSPELYKDYVKFLNLYEKRIERILEVMFKGEKLTDEKRKIREERKIDLIFDNALDFLESHYQRGKLAANLLSFIEKKEKGFLSSKELSEEKKKELLLKIKEELEMKDDHLYQKFLNIKKLSNEIANDQFSHFFKDKKSLKPKKIKDIKIVKKK